jgi:prepilin-type N-terminal cleavage/methylation domain-containing protein
MLSSSSRSLGSIPARAGFTLIELLVVLVLGALVLGLASAIGLRLQRQLSAQASHAAIEQQLAAGAELLPLDLRPLSPQSGDIALGAARDSVLDIRATIGNAAVCGSAPGAVTLAFYRGPGGRVTSSAAQTGDTLWLLGDSDTGESWHPAALATLRRTGGTCAALYGGAVGQVFDLSQLWLAQLRDTTRLMAGSVARLTRPQRFSVYRAGDGLWYLGLRTWNAATAQFNSVQPVSGPYAAPTRTGGSRFRYYDSTGLLIASPIAAGSSVARIEVVLISPDSTTPTASDSIVVVTALRNRR